MYAARDTKEVPRIEVPVPIRLLRDRGVFVTKEEKKTKTKQDKIKIKKDSQDTDLQANQLAKQN